MRLNRAGSGLLGALLALGLLVGCGGSNDKDAAPAPVELATVRPAIENRASAAAAVAVTNQYLDAILDGRAARFCALETPAFIARQIAGLVEAEFLKKGATCIEFVDKVVAASKKANPSPGVTRGYRVTAIAAIDRVVTVRVDYPQSNGTPSDAYVLIKTNGTWLIDSNPELSTVE